MDKKIKTFRKNAVISNKYYAYKCYKYYISYFKALEQTKEEKLIKYLIAAVSLHYDVNKSVFYFKQVSSILLELDPEDEVGLLLEEFIKKQSVIKRIKKIFGYNIYKEVNRYATRNI